MTEELTRQYLDEKFDDFAKIVDEKFDDFAKIVADGFAGVDRQFKDVGRQIDGQTRTILDIQAKQGEVIARVSHLEEQHTQTFNKIDGFLVLIQRHEAEIAALRSAHQRLEERIGKLEARFA